MAIIARELDYTQPREVGTPEYEFPFEKNGDFTSTIIRRNYKQTRAAFLAARPVPGAVLTDPDISSAYYMGMDNASPTTTGLMGFRRTFATVPQDQITYGTRNITKPTAASAGGTTGAIYIFYSSASGATVLGLYTSYQGYIFTPTNKIYGPLITSTSANSGGNTRITATAHGIAGTEALIVAGAGGSTARYAPVAAGAYTVVDANTIDITGYNLGTNVTSFAKYLRDYTPGTDRVGLRRTQRFYLPGVTAGINTPADIPLPSLLINDTELLASVLANTTGYQTYDASELVRWEDRPIYTQTFDEIDMATL